MHVHCTECMVCVRYVRVGVHAKVHSSTCATDKTKCKTRDLPTVFVRSMCGPHLTIELVAPVMNIQ